MTTRAGATPGTPRHRAGADLWAARGHDFAGELEALRACEQLFERDAELQAAEARARTLMRGPRPKARSEIAVRAG
jgi:hypothetical protein